jgi:riboflavin kinase/FMN adenylyltransferase
MEIKGKIEEGRKIGRTIGFPTVNLPYSGDLNGIFVGRAKIDDVWCRAAVHLGSRPTFDENKKVCEVFLLGWSEKVDVGTEVLVEVFDKIRDIKKFENLDDLKIQISEDVEFVKNWYNSRESCFNKII